MANLSKTRTVFAFTSPRTIEKIIPEIDLLVKAFAGQPWTKTTQGDFFKKLSASEFFETRKESKNPDFSARERITRAPKALGFVDLKPKIQLTEVGQQLISGKRIHETIARQLFKFQLPSPYHKIPKDRDFDVRPYLELLRITNELGNISKTEIAIFFVQLTNYRKFNDILNAIKEFRIDISKNKGNRKEFIDNIFTREILKVYSQEIELNDLKTRESEDKSFSKFIKTKKSNHIDYADALMRYLRATQYVSFDIHTFRMIVAPARKDEVDFILSSVDRMAISFKNEIEYKKYLFDPSSLKLLTDDRPYIEKKLLKLNVNFDSHTSVDTLKDLLEKTESRLISVAIEETALSLKNYKEYDDIINVFGKITKRDTPDPSLYLEWNIWRALVMINYAKEIKGNFRIDLDGIPLNTALGNVPDIIADYDNFKVIVEVTMSSGNKQYEMEGEPVARHFGKVQRESEVPVYCIFIAPKISEGALAHFFNLNRFNTKAYGGKTRIVPMSLSQFITFISIAKEKGFKASGTLKAFLDSLIDLNSKAADESEWFESIDDSIENWC